MQQLAYAAQQAMQAGRLEDAARLWSQVLARAPDHPQALFHTGQQRLMGGDIAGGLALLGRAAQADPGAPAIPLNIAFAHRKMGNSDSELASLDRALAIDPYFFPALLAKGAALERVGRPKLAGKVYADALTIAPPEDQLSAELQTALRRARKAVEENAQGLEQRLDTALKAAGLKDGAADARRIEACKAAMLGRAKIYTQKPSMLHFPELPAVQFYDRGHFPWLENLEAATDAIRDEFLKAYREDNEEFVPYVNHREGAPLNQWEELNRSARWSVRFLWKDGRKIDAACARCPRTAAAVEAVPLARIPNFAPTVNFSVLAPGTRIPPHTGSTNVRLIVHLPLIVPEGCTYRVGSETRLWQERQAWVFDDTIEHEAWNGSGQSRAILMLDIWNPFLSEAERQMVSALLNGMQEFYSTESSPIQFGG